MDLLDGDKMKKNYFLNKILELSQGRIFIGWTFNLETVCKWLGKLWR
jgi:hypothetical protein